MTEKEIQLLGFEKQVEEDTEHPFYYYTLDIANGLSFISNASDETLGGPDGDWYIEFFDNPAIRYAQFEEFQALLNNLQRHIG